MDEKRYAARDEIDRAASADDAAPTPSDFDLDPGVIRAGLDQSVICTGLDPGVLVRQLAADPYWILLRSRSTSRQRRKAARSIASKMSTRLANRAARFALKTEHAGETQQWLREEIFAPALLEAARERRRLQYIRLGPKWVTDARDRKVKVRPLERFGVAVARRWLLARARAIAAQKIIGGPRLRTMTSKERETIQLLAKHAGVTPAALRKRAARAAAQLHTSRKRSHRGRPA